MVKGLCAGVEVGNIMQPHADARPLLIGAMKGDRGSEKDAGQSRAKTKKDRTVGMSAPESFQSIVNGVKQTP